MEVNKNPFPMMERLRQVTVLDPNMLIAVEDQETMIHTIRTAMDRALGMDIARQIQQRGPALVNVESKESNTPTERKFELIATLVFVHDMDWPAHSAEGISDEWPLRALKELCQWALRKFK